MPHTLLARRSVAMLSALTTVALVAACSTASTNTSPKPSGSAGATSPSAGSLNPLVAITPPQKVDSIAALVPADLRSKSEIIVGVDPSLPPKEFMAADGKTFQGVDIDLVYAVGNVLGLKMTFKAGAFATLIPGAQNGRYDLLNSSMSPRLERQKVLDFVQTDLSGEQLLVKAGDASKLNSLDALCGTTAGVVSGANEELDMATASKKCTAGGQKAITISAFPDANSVNLALSSGRVDSGFFDTPVSAYQAQQSKGKLVNVGPIVRAGTEAMAMAKGTGFAEAVSAAMNSIIKSGVYKQIFEKWGLPKTSMLDTVIVNPPQGEKAP